MAGQMPTRAPPIYSEVFTGPAIKRYAGIHAEFQDSSVASQTLHSKLLICRPGAMDSVRL
jgi:hypothetical protein